MHSQIDYLYNTFVQEYLPNMLDLSDVLYKKSHIRLLSYTKQYDDGQSIDLCTRPDWFIHRIKHYNTHLSLTARLQHTDANYWDKNAHPAIIKMRRDAANNFNINAVVEFIYRDNIQACFHLYAFYVEKAYQKEAYDLYKSHKINMLMVIAELNNDGYQYLGDDEQKAAIHVPGYNICNNKFNTVSSLCHTLKTDYGYQFSTHEIEIMILYSAADYTPKQIANLLNTSPQGKHPIEKLRTLSGLKTQASMDAYVEKYGAVLPLFIQVIAPNIKRAQNDGSDPIDQPLSYLCKQPISTMDHSICYSVQQA